eukprot:Rhum_TRINITY_DN14237_c7_g1::Rhum_TRINITY_DN14237_c7_g1_i1::g.75197::m.75197
MFVLSSVWRGRMGSGLQSSGQRSTRCEGSRSVPFHRHDGVLSVLNVAPQTLHFLHRGVNLRAVVRCLGPVPGYDRKERGVPRRHGILVRRRLHLVHPLIPTDAALLLHLVHLDVVRGVPLGVPKRVRRLQDKLRHDVPRNRVVNDLSVVPHGAVPLQRRCPGEARRRDCHLLHPRASHRADPRVAGHRRSREGERVALDQLCGELFPQAQHRAQSRLLVRAARLERVERRNDAVAQERVAHSLVGARHLHDGLDVPPVHLANLVGVHLHRHTVPPADVVVHERHHLLPHTLRAEHLLMLLHARGGCGRGGARRRRAATEGRGAVRPAAA